MVAVILYATREFVCGCFARVSIAGCCHLSGVFTFVRIMSYVGKADLGSDTGCGALSSHQALEILLEPDTLLTTNLH